MDFALITTKAMLILGAFGIGMGFGAALVTRNVDKRDFKRTAAMTGFLLLILIFMNMLV